MSVAPRLVTPLLGVLCIAIGACHKPLPPAPEVRPVRTVVLTVQPLSVSNTYAGEVRARVESALGFRVGGKISQRLVSVGDAVTRGQPLARLDASDLTLAEAGVAAQMVGVRAQDTTARADYARVRQLYDEGFASKAELDRYATAVSTAGAQVQGLSVQARQAGNQAGYAVLTADAAGVITAVTAEAGQVVTPGQPVVRLAHAGETEVVLSVPENAVTGIQPGQGVTVKLASMPLALTGRVREVARAADPATRTFPVKVTLVDPPESLRLGMTASATFGVAAPARLPQLPLAALTEHYGQGGVWVVGPDMKARFRVAKLAPSGGDALAVLGGYQTRGAGGHRRGGLLDRRPAGAPDE